MSNSDKKIPLVEVFGPTIQGEGAVIGQQTYFMRFGLCDYRCGMCDSVHAVDPHQVKQNAEWLTQQEILDKFLKEVYLPGSSRWVTLSGGNPCIHDLSLLVGTLKRLHFRIAVETQGTFSPSWLSQCDVVTVSPKGPGMKEQFYVDAFDGFMQYVMSANPSIVNIKVVVFDQRDLEFAKMVWERYGHTGVPFYLSLGNPYPPDYPHRQAMHFPATHNAHMGVLIDEYKSLFEDIKQDPILSTMRFLPQWHVFVWGNAKGK
jgi:7-carboxy-7-deazaguanine synthase